MACRYEVTLNSVTMASLDSSIIIHDVCYDAPKYERNIFRIANLNGARTGRTYKESSSVTVLFEIHEYSISARQGVITKIINWAKNGGDLRINDRPNQKLICVCDKRPAIDSALDWLSELSITFTAYEIPYWISVTDLTTTARYSGSSTTTKSDTYKFFALEVPGDAPFVLPKSIIASGFQNTASSMDDVYFELTNSSISSDFMCVLDGLPANTSGTFEYSYNDKNIMTLQMRYGSTTKHLFGRYTNASNIYELLLKGGATNNVGISVTKRVAGSSSNTYSPLSCDVTITWRGYWE